MSDADGRGAARRIPGRASLSRRAFCLCCVGGAAGVAAGARLTPREAFAEARGLVSLIKDSATTSPIVSHMLRHGISIPQASAWTIGTTTFLALPAGGIPDEVFAEEPVGLLH